MSDEAKRIVAEETWRAEQDHRNLVMERDGHYEYDVHFVQGGARLDVAACAPEALRMLLGVEADSYGDCNFCNGTGIGYTGEHQGNCPWLALMRKAGLR